jgi:RNA polymerase sigma factor (sigma-70 family)
MILRQIRKLATTQCPSNHSDTELLQLFLIERDEAAFAAIVRRHGSMVLTVSRSVLRHQQDAEDVFQATFFVLARKADAIRKHQSLSSWLHGVAYRLALKARSQSSRRRDRETPIVDVSSSPSVEDLTLRELRVILHEELHRLPEKYRAPLLLCYWEGKTRDEAAQQLGVTAGAFKKSLERARNLLGSRLTGRGLAPSAALIATLFAADGVRAAVPQILTQSTAQAAMAFATGGTNVASAAALVLAEGAIRTMSITRWVYAVAVSLLMCGLGMALSLAGYAAFADRSPDGNVEVGVEPGSQFVALQAQAAAGDKADKDRIVGIWRFKSGTGGGKDLPPEFIALGRFTFTKDGKFIFNVVVQAKEGTYKLGEPGQIDLAGGEKDKSLALYKFDGNDRLSLCIGSDTKRPADFDAKEVAIFTLERAKPGEEKPTAEEIAKFKGGLNQVQEAAARAVSANNLKQIAIAMHNYHDTYNSFPAQAIYSKDGKTPLLSWRVAVLPYIEHADLYKEFKLDEPWDSAHNKKLIAKMPKIYEPVVGEGNKGKGLTFYQVFSGADTVFNGATGMRVAGITDGTSNTFMAVEAKDPVIWTKPADVVMPKEKNKLPAVGGLFQKGFNVMMCDGSVRFVSPTIDPMVFRNLVTPSGGEVVDFDKLDKD